MEECIDRGDFVVVGHGDSFVAWNVEVALGLIAGPLQCLSATCILGNLHLSTSGYSCECCVVLYP